MAVKLEYPTVPLVLGMMVHTAARVITSSLGCSNAICPTGSMLQGCSQSTSFARLLVRYTRRDAQALPSFEVSNVGGRPTTQGLGAPQDAPSGRPRGHHVPRRSPTSQRLSTLPQVLHHQLGQVRRSVHLLHAGLSRMGLQA
eukprot:7751501-Pyramimonas_sp.AAC.2